MKSGIYDKEVGTFSGRGNVIGSNSVTSSLLATCTSHDAVAMWNFMQVSSNSGNVRAALRLRYKVIPETQKKEDHLHLLRAVNSYIVKFHEEISYS